MGYLTVKTEVWLDDILLSSTESTTMIDADAEADDE